jgi:hypothetical protein
VIKGTINTEQRGRVLTWEKHQKMAAQRELEAAIRGARSLPEYKIGRVHNFQDILRVELNGYLPGSAYLHRRINQNLNPLNGPTKKIIQCKLTVDSRGFRMLRTVLLRARM